MDDYLPVLSVQYGEHELRPADRCEDSNPSAVDTIFETMSISMMSHGKDYLHDRSRCCTYIIYDHCICGGEIDTKATRSCG